MRVAQTSSRVTPATSALDVVLLAVALVAVSTSGPLIREAAAPTLAIAFWRTTLACVVILPVALVRHRAAFRALDRRDWRRAALAGLFLALHFGTWVPSLSFTSVASSVALTCTQPVWAAVMARARGEHIASGAWTGIGVALVGALVLTGVDFSLSARALFGDALALTGGVFGAAYVTVGADARRSMSTTVYTSICYPMAAVALLVVCLMSRQNLGHYSAHSWWIIVAITVGPQLLGHSLVNRVLRTISATTVSVAILFEIVGATLIAWWWFSETPPGGAYPAAVLIAIGVLLVVRAGIATAPPVE